MPAPPNTTAPGVARASAALRRISSSDVGQSSPMPRCAVSIASATPKPSDHRWRRYASVASQSSAASSHGSIAARGSATTCAAANATRFHCGRAPVHAHCDGDRGTRTARACRRDAEGEGRRSSSRAPQASSGGTSTQRRSRPALQARARRAARPSRLRAGSSGTAPPSTTWRRNSSHSTLNALS